MRKKKVTQLETRPWAELKYAYLARNLPVNGLPTRVGIRVSILKVVSAEPGATYQEEYEGKIFTFPKEIEAITIRTPAGDITLTHLESELYLSKNPLNEFLGTTRDPDQK